VRVERVSDFFPGKRLPAKHEMDECDGDTGKAIPALAGVSTQQSVDNPLSGRISHQLLECRDITTCEVPYGNLA
jgi:hypothetical protein